MLQEPFEQGAASTNKISPEETFHGSQDDLSIQIQHLEERLEKGQQLIDAYRQQHGMDNFRYIRHYQQLKQEWFQLCQTRDNLAQRQVSFIDSKHKKALQAFNELMKMVICKEMDTPKYQEQEALVRKMLREDEDLFQLLYFSEEA